MSVVFLSVYLSSYDIRGDVSQLGNSLMKPETRFSHTGRALVVNHQLVMPQAATNRGDSKSPPTPQDFYPSRKRKFSIDGDEVKAVVCSRKAILKAANSHLSVLKSDSDFQENVSKPPENGPKPCHCKKSKCLKM